MNFGDPQYWQQSSALTTFQPQIITTSGTNVYVQPQGIQLAPAVQPEPTPLEWLRDQVGEVCELARAA